MLRDTLFLLPSAGSWRSVALVASMSALICGMVVVVMQANQEHRDESMLMQDAKAPKTPEVFTSVDEKRILHAIDKADTHKEVDFERLVASYRDLYAREHQNFEEAAHARSSKIRHDEPSDAESRSKVFDSRNAAKLLGQAAKAAVEREQKFHESESAYKKRQDERFKQHQMQLKMHHEKEEKLLNHLLDSEQEIESSARPDAQDAIKLLDAAKDGEKVRQGQYHDLIRKYQEESRSASKAYEDFLKLQASNSSKAFAMSSQEIKADLKAMRSFIYSSKDASEDEKKAVQASQQKERDFEKRVKNLASKDQEEEAEFMRFRKVKNMLRSRIDHALSELEAPARNEHLGSLSEKKSEEKAHNLEDRRSDQGA
ncbi:hypothetical protein GUITHDRAFT_133103 [Guillardia theta CCMP2712]|uniref:Uncharacterized protein n=1 Tax=Guillardia theta (strain CCMP2712) TaxID=905079 RepID=L1JXT5_GUITC|nr:hypothetical protein GUITHDRAFT_133103 [Guillardia theta CCMP2712]EKX53376.1 hypothetical protein GUITHDRAFT_133103 [Guillardia theta CCMP2712]|eukprot:XP_005840356.1 hypothetical protein GUITHDRAFT_133103 [Guillardia theta CCMP2712]